LQAATTGAAAVIVGRGTISKVAPPPTFPDPACPVEFPVAATVAAIITAVPAPDAGAEMSAVARNPFGALT